MGLTRASSAQTIMSLQLKIPPLPLETFPILRVIWWTLSITQILHLMLMPIPRLRPLYLPLLLYLKPATWIPLILQKRIVMNPPQSYDDHTDHENASNRPPHNFLDGGMPHGIDCTTTHAMGGEVGHSTHLGSQIPGAPAMEYLRHRVSNYGQHVWMVTLFHAIGSTFQAELTPENLLSMMNQISVTLPFFLLSNPLLLAQGPTFVSLPKGSQPLLVSIMTPHPHS